MTTLNISQIINRLADKHNINVTKLRDIIEDLRVIFFERVRFDNDTGLDIYRVLKGARTWWVAKLAGGSRKPVRKPAKRRAGK